MLMTSSCAAAVQAAEVNADESSYAYVEIAQPGEASEELPYVPAIEATEPTQDVKPAYEVSFSNTSDGTKISWKAVDGASKYALYQHDGEEYKLLTFTDKLYFEHKALENGKVYLYNIKALDAEDKVFQNYAENDFSNTFIAPPVISDIRSTAEGVELSWNDCGAVRYRVYRASGNSGWSRAGETNETTFLDKTAVSGTKYTYTVRCITDDGEDFLSYHNSGKTINYVQTPSITSIDNTLTGAKVTWKLPAGVVKIRLYYKTASGWNRLCETSDTSYIHDNLADGSSYVYTVRGVDKNGDFVTDFNRDGWENTFIKAPKITSMTNTDKGVLIKWNKCPKAEKYRVYYYGSRGWTAMTDTAETSYLDTDVASGYHYTYTVRCVSNDGSRFMSYHNSGVKTQYIGLPTISSISNTLTGAKLTWKKPAGATGFRVYVRGNDGWNRLTETSDTSYEHKNLTGGKSYIYTIRCVDDDGEFVSDFNSDGWSNKFITAPVITSLTNTDKGVEIKWSKPAGAEKFRVYYYGSKGWTSMLDIADTSYLDTDVASGYRYTYTVRCVSADGKNFTSYHNSGKKIQYIGVPKITSLTNTETGTKISWSKPNGATRFRVYVRSNSGWNRLTETTSTSYVHDKLTNNTSYTYTVRCVDSNGEFVSDFNSDGWANTFILPPSISGVSKVNGANLVKWNAINGAAAYRVYRKDFNGSWSRINESTADTSFSDTTAKANTLYAYTVRCLDNNGNTVSDYYGSNTYYYNGKLASGGISVNGKTLYFENGHVRSGYQKIDGVTYYYNSSGLIEKNGIVGNAKDGYCYAGSTGAIDFGYCNGVTDGGYDWNVIEGRATKVSSDSDRTLFRALKLVYKITDTNMSRERKLRVCFDYLQNHDYTEMNPRIPDYTGMDWPIVYANDIFVDQHGNCLSFAAAFAYMAKAIGYTEVYGCNSGGHGWAEIDGLIYDPEWGMHRFNYSYYGMTYTEPCDVPYAAGIAPGYAWMHIKI